MYGLKKKNSINKTDNDLQMFVQLIQRVVFNSFPYSGFVYFRF